MVSRSRAVPKTSRQMGLRAAKARMGVRSSGWRAIGGDGGGVGSSLIRKRLWAGRKGMYERRRGRKEGRREGRHWRKGRMDEVVMNVQNGSEMEVNNQLSREVGHGQAGC